MDWQLLVAIFIVAAAGGALLRQAVRFVRGTGSGGCSACPSNARSSRVKNLPLVPLDRLHRTEHKGSSD